MNTDDQRNTNLSPHDEIKNSIFLMFSSVWESIPLIYNDFRDAFEAYYGQEYSFKKNINFCTWIGGDRDGNPNITSQTTSWALKFQRIQILKKYIDSIDTLFHELSLERKLDLRFESDINEDLKFLSIDEKVKLTHENETIRLKLLLIKKKLEKNFQLIEHDEIDFKYRYQDFKQDLLSIEKHLNDHDFMVGNQFSGADILVAQTFMWAQMVKFPLDMPASLEFLARMKERDGYQRALAI